MRFKFDDDKSRRQINRAINHRNDTRQQNAKSLLNYQIKRSRLADSRGLELIEV